MSEPYFYRPARSAYRPKPAEPESTSPIHAMTAQQDAFVCAACGLVATLTEAIAHVVAKQWTA